MPDQPAAHQSATTPPIPWNQRTGSRSIVALLLLLTGILTLTALYRPPRTAPANQNLTDIRSQMKVQINRASAADLQVIPGIGPALAHRIITNRQAQGDFQALADLDRVSGIGERTIEKIAPYLVLTPSLNETTNQAPGN